MRATKYLGAVYRAELAVELQRLGYALRHDRQGMFELAHMKRGQLAAFSQRAAQIERRLAAEGLTPDSASAAQKQRVKLATRPRKVSADRQALFAEWRERARDFGIDFDRRAGPLETWRREGGPTLDPSAHAAAEGARRSVRFAVAHLTERQAIVSERELLDVALKHAVGSATLTDVMREVGRLSRAGYLIPESPLYRSADGPANAPGLPRDAWVRAREVGGAGREQAREEVDRDIATGRLVAAERRFKTQTALERERRILRVERDGRGAVAAIADPESVRLRLTSTRLGEGQRAAVELITTAPHRVVGVQGYAGTGKSQMLAQAKRIVEERGYQVVAVAPYAAQARTLRELGVETRTLASFLAARERSLTERTVLVIDEAGTVPARQMEQALRLAEEGGARVVLLGDTRQTKAIEAGRPFDQLRAAGMAVAVMGDIQRQRDPSLRQAVALAARGEAEASLAHLREVREIGDDHDRRRAIAADYVRLQEDERSRTLVVSGTNEARRELNRAIREDLGFAGRGSEVATLTRRDTTQAERCFAKNFAVGDLIQPERDYPRFGLSRGVLYEIVENGPGNRLDVRGEAGEAIEFSPMTCRKLSVYEPERTAGRGRQGADHPQRRGARPRER